MTTPTAVAAVRELIATADLLQSFTDPFAVKAKRDCWSCVADLEFGSHCEEAAHTLVLSVEHWLERAA